MRRIPALADIEHLDRSEMEAYASQAPCLLTIDDSGRVTQVRRGWRMRMLLARRIGARGWRTSFQLLTLESYARDARADGISRRSLVLGGIGAVVLGAGGAAVGAAPAMANEKVSPETLRKHRAAITSLSDKFGSATKVQKLTSSGESVIVLDHGGKSVSLISETDSRLVINASREGKKTVLDFVQRKERLALSATSRGGRVRVEWLDDPSVSTTQRGPNETWRNCMYDCLGFDVSADCLFSCAVGAYFPCLLCAGSAGFRCAVRCRTFW